MRRAWPSPTSDVAAEIKKLYGDKNLDSGKIKLDVPEIAENGLVVPVNVDVESPMTDADYVKSVHVFADGNPQPGIVSYNSRRLRQGLGLDPHAPGADPEHRLRRRNVERTALLHGQGK